MHRNRSGGCFSRSSFCGWVRSAPIAWKMTWNRVEDPFTFKCIRWREEGFWEYRDWNRGIRPRKRLSLGLRPTPLSVYKSWWRCTVQCSARSYLQSIRLVRTSFPCVTRAAFFKICPELQTFCAPYWPSWADVQPWFGIDRMIYLGDTIGRYRRPFWSGLWVWRTKCSILLPSWNIFLRIFPSTYYFL